MPERLPDPTPQRVRGPIRVDGMLRLAPDTLYEDDVHAPGGLLARPGSIVVGDVYTDGPVQLAATARIGGRVRPAEGSSRPGSAGAMRRLLAAAERGDLDADRVGAALGPLGEALLDEAPGEPWSPEAVRDGLLARGLARVAAVTIEHQAEGPMLVRLRRQGGSSASGGDALVRLVRSLVSVARPQASVTVLGSPSTPGDAVLLVEP